MFNAKDMAHYNYLDMDWDATAWAPYGYEMVDGAQRSSVSQTTRTSANVPTYASGDIMWVQVECLSGTVKVRMANQTNEPADWSTVSTCYEGSDFADTSGGRIGFAQGAWGGGTGVDDVRVEAYVDSSWVTQVEEDFEVDSSYKGSETVTNDAAGNLTYDGEHTYVYDAWNRLAEVKRAYRDGSDTLTTGSTIATIEYDGLGRRIVKDIDNSGDWDCEYHYYYDGQQMVEMRDGSDDVLKRYVWGLEYVDELIGIMTGDSYGCSHYALHDANYNVIGLVDTDGDLVERYEYTPYGQRTIYKSAGSDDALVMAPILESQRVQVSGIDQPYGLCDFGHQGLLHDKEFGLIYNRARYLDPILGRYTGPDPLDYPDGMSLYEYVGSSPIDWADPWGRETTIAMEARKAAEEVKREVDKKTGKERIITKADRVKEAVEKHNKAIDRIKTEINRPEVKNMTLNGKRIAKKELTAILDGAKVSMSILDKKEKKAIKQLRGILGKAKPGDQVMLETHSDIESNVLCGGRYRTPKEVGELLVGAGKGYKLIIGGCFMDKEGMQLVANALQVPVAGTGGDWHDWYSLKVQDVIGEKLGDINMEIIYRSTWDMQEHRMHPERPATQPKTKSKHKPHEEH